MRRNSDNRRVSEVSYPNQTSVSHHHDPIWTSIFYRARNNYSVNLPHCNESNQRGLGVGISLLKISIKKFVCISWLVRCWNEWWFIYKRIISNLHAYIDCQLLLWWHREKIACYWPDAQRQFSEHHFQSYFLDHSQLGIDSEKQWVDL